MLISKFIKWFRKKSFVNQESFGRWLEKDHPENTYAIEGFDCSHFVQSMQSVTEDPNIATSFVTLRHSNGSEYHGKLPDNSVEIFRSLEYPYYNEIRNGAMFKAHNMEQKWDIYLYDDRLYFCRSWTGELCYVASCITKDRIVKINNIWSTEDRDRMYAIREVDYLIKSHLYSYRVPHPLPKRFPRDSQILALYSFNRYGNICTFGTFENTLT